MNLSLQKKLFLNVLSNGPTKSRFIFLLGSVKFGFFSRIIRAQFEPGRLQGFHQFLYTAHIFFRDGKFPGINEATNCFQPEFSTRTIFDEPHAKTS